MGGSGAGPTSSRRPPPTMPKTRQHRSTNGVPFNALTVRDFVDRLNAVEPRAPGERPKWNRWNARTLAEGVGVRFRQKGPRCKLYVTYEDLRESGLMEAFLGA